MQASMLPGSTAPPLSTFVDMTGLTLVRGPNDPYLSLETLDTEQSAAPSTILLNSPRSVEACLRLGIRPHELLKLHNAPSEQHYVFHDRRRADKLRKLLACREEVSAEFDAKLDEMEREEQGSKHNPLIEKERARLAKINASAEARTRALETVATTRRQKQAERTSRVEEQVARLHEERAARRAAAAERTANLAESREVFKAARVAIDETRREAALSRAAQVEQQRARRRWQQELTRQDHELRNAVHAADSRRRQLTIQQRQAAESNRKELAAAQRMQAAELVKQAVDAAKAEQQRDVAAAAAALAVKTARNRARLVEATKVTLDEREAALQRAEEYRAALARQREDEVKKRREEAAAAAAAREALRQQAEAAALETAAQIEARALHADAVHELMGVQRDVLLRKKQLVAHLKDEERKEVLERTKRADEYKRYQLLTQLQEKQARIEKQQAEAKAIVEEHRQEVQRLAAKQQSKFSQRLYDSTPGPGEYDVERGFALLSEFEAQAGVNFAMGERLVNAPDDLPGPGAYDLIDENVRRRARPAIGIPKSVA